MKKNQYYLHIYLFFSFGLTFFETLILNRPVFLINPTNYHDSLTEEFGYPFYIKRENNKDKNKDEFFDIIIFNPPYWI